VAQNFLLDLIRTRRARAAAIIKIIAESATVLATTSSC
jgi:hypothetical protein